MYTVTERAKKFKQPYGGFIPVKSLNKLKIDDGCTLNEEENIHPSIVGLAVDYLTRFMISNDAESVFSISMKGACILDAYKRTIFIKYKNKAKKLIKKITSIDNDETIIAACKLSGFDICYRASVTGYKPIEKINPDKNTVENIRIMVKRSLKFLKDYGPVVKSEFTFEGGYTYIISSGDGDYLTEDGLWDFKVSKGNFTSKQTLQILIYYLMGLKSIHEEFWNVKKIGLFNPRKNLIAYIEIKDISDEVLTEVCKEVIGY